MMKDEFLARLKELLGDLPQEEREEAVRYYEDYFADAGPLEEMRVLRELVSPEDVAEKILAGCGSREKADEGDVFAENIFGNSPNAAKVPKDSGMKKDARTQGGTAAPEGNGAQDSAGAEPWAQSSIVAPEENGVKNGTGAELRTQSGTVAPEENGVQDSGAAEPWTQDSTVTAKEPWPYNGAEAQGESWMQNSAGDLGDQWAQEDAREQERRMRMGETYAQDYGDDAGYARDSRRSRAGYGGGPYPRGATVRTKSYFSPVIFILALIIGLPILCPMLLAFIVMMGGFFVGFGIGGVGLVAGGVALIGNALSNISMGSGLICLLSGSGLILAALGILFIVFAVNCAFRAIPALFRGIRRIFLALRGRRA